MGKRGNDDAPRLYGEGRHGSVSFCVLHVRYVSLNHDDPCRMHMQRHIWFIMVVARVTNIAVRLSHEPSGVKRYCASFQDPIFHKTVDTEPLSPVTRALNVSTSRR